jgi:hypothetical protein
MAQLWLFCLCKGFCVRNLVKNHSSAAEVLGYRRKEIQRAFSANFHRDSKVRKMQKEDAKKDRDIKRG